MARVRHTQALGAPRRPRYRALRGAPVGRVALPLECLGKRHLLRSPPRPLHARDPLLLPAPYRMLMVWVYERTGSLLVAILMHASLVAFWIISTPVGIAGMPLVTWYLVWAAALWAVVGAVAMANHRHISRQPPLQ